MKVWFQTVSKENKDTAITDYLNYIETHICSMCWFKQNFIWVVILGRCTWACPGRATTAGTSNGSPMHVVLGLKLFTISSLEFKLDRMNMRKQVFWQTSFSQCSFLPQVWCLPGRVHIKFWLFTLLLTLTIR